MSDKTDLSFPLLVSAGIHIGVIVILALGIDFTEKPKELPQASAPPIQAVMIDQQKVSAQVEKLKQQKNDKERQERERQAELERRAEEARKAREREQEQIKKLEIERKQKEIETLKAAEAARESKLKLQQEKERAEKAEAIRKQKELERQAAEEAAKKAADKRKAEEAAAAKAAAERKQKEEAERKAKEEAERKRKAEEEAARKRKAEADARARQEQEMADALAAEQAALSQTRNKQVMSEVQRYTAMIRATIQRNLVVDEFMRGKSCRVFIRLANDGFVTSSQTLDGDPQVCRAATAAINKAGRLPVSSDPNVYSQLKEINLIVSPEFN